MFTTIPKYLVFLTAVLCLASCEKKEELWDLPPASANETIKTLDLGANYENVIYYQFATQRTSMANLFSWDLAFSTDAGAHHITMNGGKEVQLYNTHDTDFAKTTYAVTKINWQWDNPNGDKDSTAVGAWCDEETLVSKNEVYVFDLSKKNSPRYKKVKFLSVNANEYVIKVANMDNSDAYELTIAKDATRNFIYLNLQSGETVSYEPLSTDWDIVFTRYRHVYYDMDPVTPYLVNGVLINGRHVTINETRTLKYEDINAEKAAQLLMTNKADEIGYDWKFYNLDAGKYTVDPNQVFIIKLSSGEVYKLRFVDFYNEQGTKGFPKFTYQRL